MSDRIFLAEPHLIGNERKYVLECIDSSWISSIGKFIQEFEQGFAEFAGTKHAIATNNGTTALHLALTALDIGPGDEVLVPTLTYVATANAVRYCGATPVFVDSEASTLGIDPEAIEERITPRTRAVIPVHLYGHPANMSAIREIAERRKIKIVEDAAEAHGASVEGVRVGGLGDCATFSFFGNKIMTTGEGGIVTTNDDALAERLRLFRGQGMDPAKRYWFPVVGFNYRMTNIQAAIGLAQLERIDEALANRKRLAEVYRERLSKLGAQVSMIQEQPWAHEVHWLQNVFVQQGDEMRRDSVMQAMDKMGIETRPVFYPMHVLPPHRCSDHFPVADRFAGSGISLPLHEGLDVDDIDRVVKSLASALEASP